MQKIAIIEDDESTNNRLKALVLSIPDVNVSQAFTREEGIDLITNNQFDLVIVDVDLGPGPKDKYGGFEIVSLLSNCRTVTLVVSGMPQTNLHELAISLRAYDFIGKPINELAFINKVEHALASHARDLNENKDDDNVTLPPGLTRDPTMHACFCWKGKKVRLTLTQLRLVECLVATPGIPVSKTKLAAQLGTSNSEGALATHLSEVRQRFLAADPNFKSTIESEPGAGYFWKVEE